MPGFGGRDSREDEERRYVDARRDAGRSADTGQKTIRSSPSSSGSVTSTIAVPSGAISSTPPRAPAGAASTGSDSWTKSKAAISRVTAMSVSVGPRVGGYGPRRGAPTRQMPDGDRQGGTTAEGEWETHLAQLPPPGATLTP